MNFAQIQAYAGLWLGSVVMISFHHMIVSAILYKVRQTNVSCVLKIIFNLGQIVHSVGKFCLYMAPKAVTLVRCTALQYLTMVGYVLMRLSLSAFLLWRLGQICNNWKDKCVCTVLFAVRSMLAIPYLILQKPFISDVNIMICNVDNTNYSKVFDFCGIIVEILIDIYVTIRLIQILHKNNRNAQISSNMGRKNKRSLFTVITYWNFLRLFVSFILYSTDVLERLKILLTEEIPLITVKCIIYIALSYIITVNAEIVKVFEDKRKKKSSGSSTGKDSLASMSQNPRTLPHYDDGNDISYDLPANEQDHSQLDEDKVEVVVQAEKLSFFEWANAVTGNRLRRSNNNEGDRATINT